MDLTSVAFCLHLHYIHLATMRMSIVLNAKSIHYTTQKRVYIKISEDNQCELNNILPHQAKYNPIFSPK